jgi:glucokinase
VPSKHSQDLIQVQCGLSQIQVGHHQPFELLLGINNPGRKYLMAIDNKGYLTVGMDLGGTKLATAVVDSQGNILVTDYRLIDASKDPDRVIHQILESYIFCVEQAGKKPSAVGLGVAGQIDKTQGIVHSSPNLPGWNDVSLKACLEAVLKIPVIIDNDVRMITRGEWQHGAGKGLNDLVCLFIGTGIGGGVVSGGHLLEGCDNTASELGHLTIVAGGRKCHCPNEGCLEAYAGGWAIAERAQDAARANPQAARTLVSLAGSLNKITSITVSEAYKKGDPLSQRLIKDTLKYLSSGVVSIVNAFNPCLIVMGGSVIGGFPNLISSVEQRVRAQALPTPARSIHITAGELGHQAGVIGAAVHARSLIE